MRVVPWGACVSGTQHAGQVAPLLSLVGLCLLKEQRQGEDQIQRNSRLRKRDGRRTQAGRRCAASLRHPYSQIDNNRGPAINETIK